MLQLCAYLIIANATPTTNLEPWANYQETASVQKLTQNIGPEGASRGAVVASPSKSAPNYFRHWIRDAALTMDVVIDLYERARSDSEKQHYSKLLADYIDFSRQNQLTKNPSNGLGEPLFNADGSAFLEGWGRPQNDSAAIRAFVLTRWANVLLNEGQSGFVVSKLYAPSLPAHTVIKADLEYISHHWRETSFDLWEEIRGNHFYTRMVQRRALIDGALLARRLGDPQAAEWYDEQASQLAHEINRHWNFQSKQIDSTLDRDDGVNYKHSNLDASIVLAVLHGNTSDTFFEVADGRVLNTVTKLEKAFAEIYPINKHGVGIAIGRYPEDHYDGVGFSEGNPWFLLTAAFAEYYYKLAQHILSEGKLTITKDNISFFSRFMPTPKSARVGQRLGMGNRELVKLVTQMVQQGNAYLERVKQHASHDGSLSEQMNRHNGYMQGARDLTWSYAAFLRANWDRAKLQTNH